MEKWSPWNKLSVLIMDLLRSLLMWAEAGSLIPAPAVTPWPCRRNIVPVAQEVIMENKLCKFSVFVSVIFTNLF